MNNTTENNIMKAFNRVAIYRDTVRSLDILPFIFLVFISCLAYYVGEHLGLANAIFGAICLSVMEYGSNLEKKHHLKGIFIRNVGSLTVISLSLISGYLLILLGEGVIVLGIVQSYFFYYGIVVIFMLASWIGYILMKARLFKFNFTSQKKPGNILIAVPIIIVLQLLLDDIFERYPYFFLYVGIMVFLGAVILYAISIGTYIVYFGILNKYPNLEQKCLEVRPMHEAELEKTDPNIARYMEKKRAEEKSNMH